MPGWDWGDDGYAASVARVKALEAKLRAKGIVPGSSKWYKLMARGR